MVSDFKHKIKPRKPQGAVRASWPLRIEGKLATTH